MNTLSFRTTDDNGLSFELLVDGEPLGALIGARDTAIPYWIVGDDLPHVPPSGNETDADLRIVTVCSCGEYGCGCTECRVIQEGECVTLYDFDLDVSREGRQKVFSFPKPNYDEVVGEIARQAPRVRS